MMKWTLAVNPPAVRERGQALVIVAFAMVALVAFIGFTVDTGILFISNGHLRRAVDAAALSAATQFREGSSLAERALAAKEFMALNNVDPQSVSVDDCTTDTSLCTDPPRKFVRVRATQIVQFAFLPIIGFGRFPITAEATSEAASVDAVIVIGASETMAREYPTLVGYGDPFNPTQCNLNATIYPNSSGDGSAGNPYKCRPLWDAKVAAKAFVKQMYDGYDQVAVVTYDFKPDIYSALTANLGTDDTGSNFDATGVYRVIDQIPIYDEKPTPLTFMQGIHGGANPLDFNCNFMTPGNCPGTPSEASSFLAGCSGCGLRVAANILKTTGRPSSLWVIVFLSDGVVNMADMPVSFYSDAASRQGTIRDAGISATNFPNGYCTGDISGYNPADPADPTQFDINPLWSQPFCVTGGHDLSIPPDGDMTDPYGGPYRSEMNYQNISVRHCGPYNPGGAGSCPPGAIYVGALGYTTTVTPTAYYDALDYARDMVDQAALQVNCRDKVAGGEQCTGVPPDKYNQNEPVAGTNLAIYSIGLGAAANPPDFTGEEFLRYVADVGDDGDRVTKSCPPPSLDPNFHRTNCGNYYYAPTGAGLIAIFEDIAKRIFTRLTR